MPKQTATLWPLNENSDRWVAHVGGDTRLLLGSGLVLAPNPTPRYMIYGIDELDELIHALHDIRPAMIAAELGTPLDEGGCTCSDRYTFTNGDGTRYGDGTVTIDPYGEHIALEVTDARGTTGVMINHPDDARRIAVRLVREAAALEDRLDIYHGNGGDQ